MSVFRNVRVPVAEAPTYVLPPCTIELEAVSCASPPFPMRMTFVIASNRPPLIVMVPLEPDTLATKTIPSQVMVELTDEMVPVPTEPTVSPRRDTVELDRLRKPNPTEPIVAELVFVTTEPSVTHALP